MGGEPCFPVELFFLKGAGPKFFVGGPFFSYGWFQKFFLTPPPKTPPPMGLEGKGGTGPRAKGKETRKKNHPKKGVKKTI